MKHLTRIVSLVLAIFLFMGTAAISAEAAGALTQGIGFVSASSLRLRSQPSTASATLDYAPRNDVVVVLGKSGQWYQVNYNLQTGFMHQDHLRVTTRENAELGYGEITGSRVNIRSGPGTNYAVIAQGKAGEKGYIIGVNNQWYKIIFGNTIGYIRSDYMKLTQIPYENQDSPNKPLFFVGGKSTGVKPSASALQKPGTTNANAILATAKIYLGVPYVWGGSTPNGFDCSGFVQYVFAKHGISLPRTSKQQWTVGTSVSKSNLVPGDLVFFANTYTSGVSHLGIYMGSGQFIHASSSKGVIISELSNSYWSSHYHGAKRIL